MSMLGAVTPDSASSTTFVELSQKHATRIPDALAFTFLAEGENRTDELRYGDLERRARSIAVALRERVHPGDRALLLYPPGLEYVVGFLGCLFAGVIAVPAYPPEPVRARRSLPRLQAILRDAGPSVALTTSSTYEKLLKSEGQPGAGNASENNNRCYRAGELASLEELGTLPWLITDQVTPDAADQWRMPQLAGDTVAFLQYTSGSTGTPRGVMVTHRNLLHNSALIKSAFKITTEHTGVIWLPMYHDMGLIGGVLQPLYTGIHTTLMSPLAFLQWPLRWLKAISALPGRPIVSGGPNFAYDLCTKKITDEQKASLDLRHWACAFSGAEPVRAETLERFAEAFSSCGFRREAFYPCYGLAEATLFVAGGDLGRLPTILAVDKNTLQENRILIRDHDGADTQQVVTCGISHGGQQVVIVNPETLQPCRPGDVGEVWVSGLSVAAGYWQKEEVSREIFRATLAGTSAPEFLRTGDLGAFVQGELIITGRSKDLIIIRGRNHYPQDIEQTVEGSHPALRQGSGAAFAVEGEGTEDLVIVHEIRPTRQEELEDIVAAIIRAVADVHELQVGAIALIKRGSIPKTSSGKIQRHACKRQFLDGSLELILLWRLVPTAPEAQEAEARAPSAAAEGAQAPSATVPQAVLETWLIEHLARALRIPPSSIDTHQPFASFGLDSARAVALTGDLASWLGRPLSPTLVWDYPSVEKLARFLSGEPTAAAHALPAQAGTEPEAHEPIAIVGIGCRFPGAPNVAAFWQMLHGGKDAIREVPSNRWDLDQLYDDRPATPGKMVTRWGGFIDDVDKFDPSFFGIAPREASRMDPQQRLMLEVTWEALEYAGILPEQLAGSRTGVFLGISNNDYATLQHGSLEAIDAYTGTGNAFSIAANRVSYLLDLRGPSVALDTACSSSLVAVHLGVGSLRRRESDLAVAGGVNLILTPELTVTFSQARMMSPSGHCRTFDAAADGYVRGEGCGIVILKRLSDADRDGDPVLAVIRGSAVNQDGRSNGITAPNGAAQQAVIREALRDAGAGPDLLGYVEAHGTGTPLGDPIEVQSLGEVLAGRDRQDPCLLGSIKTNIGHLEAAAGVAGLIKTALMLHHGMIVPHLHFTSINPHIPLEKYPLQITTTAVPWEHDARRRRLAGVSSFGFGGTNAHVVLEEAPIRTVAKKPASRGMQLLTLSARSDAALRASTAAMAEWLRDHDEVDLAAVSALLARRTRFPHRLALAGATAGQVTHQLHAHVDGEQCEAVAAGEVHPRGKIAFLFTGQGAQYPGMGKRLYESEPLVHDIVDSCDALFRELSGVSLCGILFAESGSDTRIHETTYTQPALFVLEYALARLWQSWGIEPDIMIGHSIGEYVAACVAGAFSLEDGVRLVSARGRLMGSLPRNGAMAALMAEASVIRPLLAGHEGDVAVAAENSPANTVIAGARDAVQDIVRRFEEDGGSARPLTVSHAFHSPLMDPILDAFEEEARRVQYAALKIPVISNLTGTAMTARDRYDSAYWRRHLRSTVLFAAGVKELAGAGVTTFVECGPTATLTALAKATIPGAAAEWIPSLKRERDDREVMLEGAGRLFVAGYDPRPDRGQVDHLLPLDLPSTPFERVRCWVDEPAGPVQRGISAFHGHPFLKRRLSSPLLDGSAVFEGEVSLETLPALADHRILGMPLLPAVMSAEASLAAVRDAFGWQQATVTELAMLKPCVIPATGSRIVQVVLTPDEGPGRCSFRLFSRGGAEDEPEEWVLHSTGKIGSSAPSLEAAPSSSGNNEDAGSQAYDTEAFYVSLARAGLEYGPAFRCVQHLVKGAGVSTGELALPDASQTWSPCHLFPPSLLDAGLHLLAAALPEGEKAQGTFLPVLLEEVACSPLGEGPLQGYATVRSANERAITGDVILRQGDRAVAVMRGVRLQRVSPEALAGMLPERISGWLYDVTWTPLQTPTSQKEIPSGPWLIYADRGGMGGTLGAKIAALGKACYLIAPGENAMRTGENSWSVRPGNDDDMREAFSGILANDGEGLRGVIYLAPVDARTWSNLSPAAFARTEEDAARQLLSFVQQLVSHAWPVPPRFWMVTSGAWRVGSHDAPVEPLQAMLWGFAGSLANEHPELRCTSVDLDPVLSAEMRLNDLLRELKEDDVEDRVAYREGQRHAARLRNSGQTRRVKTTATTPAPLRKLVVTERGSLANLAVVTGEERAPGPGEVEVGVVSAGVNFRDVMNALGLYPGDAGPLGGEFAGRIVAVGEGVNGFVPGDRVMGLTLGTFSNHVIASQDLVVKLPAQVSLPDAGGLPIAFLTGYYAFHRLARLKAGERVLVHAGTGGVGLAAIQLAHASGAEVLATAGSEEKRNYLRRLGINCVMDSRTLAFADEVMKYTGGEGVDVVLNSFAGEFIPKGLSCLARGGRFVEIGKVGIWSQEAVAALRSDVGYWTVALDDMARNQMAIVQEMLQAVAAMFAQGTLVPLPSTAYPLDDAADAFRLMARARHIGKLIVMPGLAREGIRGGAIALKPGVTCLLTGGTGALGMVTARWLADHSVSHLLLIGHAPPAVQAQESIEQLLAAGVNVRVVTADITDEKSIRTIASVLPEMPPVALIVHAAGVLHDGLIERQSWSTLAGVLGPKTRGLWNLLRLVPDAESVVLFSSVASVLGPSGQSNYAAANSFLDAMAEWLSSRGVRACSINWAPWQIGMAGGRGHDFSSEGFTSVTADTGRLVLDTLLQACGPRLVVMPMDWAVHAGRHRGSRHTSFVRELVRKVLPAQALKDGNGLSKIRERLLGASREERPDALREYLLHILAKVMGVESSMSLDASRPLGEMGLDSLMAMELKNTVEKELKIVIPIAQIISGPSIDELAQFIALRLGSRQEEKGEQKRTPQETPSASLSHGQRAMWFQCRMDRKSVFNLFYAVRTPERVDVERLHGALARLVQRHAALRTTFAEVAGAPIAHIRTEVLPPLSLLDASDWTDERLREELRQEAEKPFDLVHGPLFRVTLFVQGGAGSTLLIAMHHIITDTWSQAILVSELVSLYNEGESAQLPPLESAYQDYVNRQEALLGSGEGERLRRYWSGKLAGPLPPLDLPLDHPRPRVQSYDGAVVSRTLDGGIMDDIRIRAKELGTTVNTLGLALFYALLHRYTGQRDLIVGMPAAGRNNAEYAAVVGYFTNPLPLRVQVESRMTFAELVRAVQAVVLEGLEHQAYPLPLMVEQFGGRRDPGWTPLFQAMFVLQRLHVSGTKELSAFALGDEGAKASLGGIPLESVTLRDTSAPFDLTLQIAEEQAGLAATLTAPRALFEEATLERMLAEYGIMLAGAVANPETRIDDLPLLSMTEHETRVTDWNARSAAPAWQPVHDLIEEQARSNPSAPAVVCGNAILTYGELAVRATHGAAHLAALGVRTDVPVGICYPRSVDLAVAVLAVLKSGGAFVPLDPAAPEHRLAWMANDAGVHILLSNCAGGSLSDGRTLFTLEQLEQRDGAQSWQAPPVPREALAYIIYTSGSTGVPKGVMVQHHGLTQVMQATAKAYRLDSTSRVLQFASFSFDAAVQEILSALAAGATLYMMSQDTLLSPYALLNTISSNAITNVTLPPSLLTVLPPQDLPSLRTIVSAGEACSIDVARRWVDGRHFVNAYGPTEATVCATWQVVDDQILASDRTHVPIGGPLEGTRVAILDARGRPLPIGVPGEIVIGGPAVARGYNKRPDLTAERFLPDPLSRTPGARLLWTGDRGRYLPDGTIEFLGRTDDQVKIRGFRIEPGEVEAALREIPGVRDAAVVARGDGSGGKNLVGYVVSTGGETSADEVLRRALRLRLPEYMVPTAFVHLPSLPVTEHGKMDRRALPAPEVPALDQTAQPVGDLEEGIAAIWRSVLGRPTVGRHDNFFDLGGHSLALVKVQVELHEKLQKDISLVDLLRFPSISALAGYLSRGEESAGEMAEAVEERALRQRLALGRQVQRAKDQREVHP